MDRLDPRVRQEALVQLDLPDQQDNKVLKETQETQEYRDQLVLVDQLDHRVRRDRKDNSVCFTS